MKAVILHSFYGGGLIYIRSDAIDLMQTSYDAELGETYTTIFANHTKVHVREDMATIIELIKNTDKEGEEHNVRDNSYEL